MEPRVQREPVARPPFTIPTLAPFANVSGPAPLVAPPATVAQTLAQAQLSWPGIQQKEIEAALNNDFSRGDSTRALALLQHYADAVGGVVTPARASATSPYPTLRGASNYRGITCYIDSLLIAMFSRLENFEPLLYQRFDDSRTDMLATWLRLTVNLMRSGELVTADIVSGLLAASYGAGWAVPGSDNGPITMQQDAAEYFGFITEKLCMPLLALRVNIAHAGVENAEEDNKTVTEQLLYLPIPGSTDDEPILLEECLELYFANNIEVNRHPESRSAGYSLDWQPLTPDVPPARHRRSYSIVSTVTRRPQLGDDASVEISRDSTTTRRPQSGDEASVEMSRVSTASERAEPSTPTQRESSPQPGPSTPMTLPTYQQLFSTTDDMTDAKLKMWTSRNEISFPAWMFLQLMPFYVDSRNTLANLDNLEAYQVAQHFTKTHPVLGFCLKRYYMDEQGRALRNGRRVIIPETIYLPSFVADDSDRAQAFGNFKLVLESAIFHQGKELNSGHYMSLTSEDIVDDPSYNLDNPVPSEPKKLWRGRKKKHQPSNSDGEGTDTPQPLSTSRPPSFAASTRRWLLCDDLRPPGEKVEEVDFASTFERHVPYMLFYRMVALDPPPFDSRSSSRDTSPLLLAAQNNDPVKPSLNFYDNPGKPAKRLSRPKFLRKPKDRASTYREEKCVLM